MEKDENVVDVKCRYCTLTHQVYKKTWITCPSSLNTEGARGWHVLVYQDGTVKQTGNFDNIKTTIERWKKERLEALGITE